ncbi:hypothetical protein KZ813_06450 [Sphingomonas sp. RHCKR7]|uniref:hypothetical protein n=1 Tax=Sphingomonas folli TaxID=2862497 RepID=UPI001CA4CBCD|nr:hypothetical protein [Sphingomonas folli]MBW6526477.1 hypothetical protein [Sphingomonas folli]
MKVMEEAMSTTGRLNPGLSEQGAGEAALLLIESLLHGLIARAVLSTEEAIKIVEIAADARRELADDRIDDLSLSERSIGALMAIASSLRTDMPD